MPKPETELTLEKIEKDITEVYNYMIHIMDLEPTYALTIVMNIISKIVVEQAKSETCIKESLHLIINNMITFTAIEFSSKSRSKSK